MPLQKCQYCGGEFVSIDPVSIATTKGSVRWMVCKACKTEIRRKSQTQRSHISFNRNRYY